MYEMIRATKGRITVYREMLEQWREELNAVDRKNYISCCRESILLALIKSTNWKVGQEEEKLVRFERTDRFDRGEQTPEDGEPWFRKLRRRSRKRKRDYLRAMKRLNGGSLKPPLRAPRIILGVWP